MSSEIITYDWTTLSITIQTDDLNLDLFAALPGLVQAVGKKNIEWIALRTAVWIFLRNVIIVVSTLLILLQYYDYMWLYMVGPALGRLTQLMCTYYYWERPGLHRLHFLPVFTEHDDGEENEKSELLNAWRLSGDYLPWTCVIRTGTARTSWTVRRSARSVGTTRFSWSEQMYHFIFKCVRFSKGT